MTTQPSEQTPPPPFANIPITNDEEAESRIASLLSGEPAPGKVTDSEAVEAPQDDAAPVETQPSGEEAESEPAPEPPIAAPASWTADAKDAFRSLPRTTQEYVLKRETERDAAVRTAQNEAAEARKAVEADRQAALSERQQYAQRLQSLVPALEAEITRDDFGKLTPQQRLQFAQEDPAGYTVRKEQFEQKFAILQQAHHEQQLLTQRQQTETNERQAKYVAEQAKLLAEKFPEFVDEKTGPALKAKAKSLLKEQGYSDEEIGQLSDHRAVGLVRLALKGLEASTKKEVATAKVANLPKVSKPGTVAAPGEMSAQKRVALRTKIGQMTNDDDIANALAEFVN